MDGRRYGPYLGESEPATALWPRGAGQPVRRDPDAPCDKIGHVYSTAFRRYNYLPQYQNLN
jgi:hypothetical protein